VGMPVHSTPHANGQRKSASSSCAAVNILTQSVEQLSLKSSHPNLGLAGFIYVASSTQRFTSSLMKGNKIVSS
jgi:hypothetical protein